MCNLAHSVCVYPAATSTNRSYRAIVFADVWSNSWMVERNAIIHTYRYTEFLFLLEQYSINFIWFTCCSMHVLNKQPTLYPEPDAPLALYFDRWWQSVSSRLALLLLLPLSSLTFSQKLNRRVVTAAHKLSSQNRSGSVLVLRGVLAVRGRAWQRGCGSCYRPPRSREPSARRTLFSDGHAPFTTAAFTSVGHMRSTYLSAYWHQDWSYFCCI